jgi:hypothetical protein
MARATVSTKPEVFVIESLDPDDEGNGRFEGAIISRMLRLHGKICEYRYVRTRKEFKRAVTQFGKSRYRYLPFRVMPVRQACARQIRTISTSTSWERYSIRI